jgi:hypothetical protein
MLRSGGLLCCCKLLRLLMGEFSRQKMLQTIIQTTEERVTAGLAKVLVDGADGSSSSKPPPPPPPSPSPPSPPSPPPPPPPPPSVFVFDLSDTNNWDPTTIQCLQTLSYFNKFKSEFVKQQCTLVEFDRILQTAQRHPFLKLLPNQDVTKQVVLLVPCEVVIAQGTNLLVGLPGQRMVRCLAIASICASMAIPQDAKENYRTATKASKSIFFPTHSFSS